MSNFAPARTSATRWGALTARHLAWADSMSINGSTTGGGHLSCHAAHHRWTGYCEQAGVEIDIHQLRHTHATELINNGVSIEADARARPDARIQRFGG